MNKFMAGQLSTAIMLAFIAAGVVLIALGIGDDGHIFLPLYGLIFLTLAAVIRVWKDFLRKPKSRK